MARSWTRAPEAKTRVDEGTKVNLVVSSGPAQSVVPVLVGRSLDDATTALTNAGLSVGTVTRKDSDQDANQVLGSDPAEGKQVPTSSKVNLTIATGNNKVPEVIGMTLREARTTLTNAGFKVDDGGAQDDTAKVLDQSPDPGTSLRLGSTIALSVEQPAPPPSTPSTPTPSQTPPTSSPATPATTPPSTPAG